MAGGLTSEPAAVAAVANQLRSLQALAIDSLGGASPTESLSSHATLDEHLNEIARILQNVTPPSQAAAVLETASRSVFYDILSAAGVDQPQSNDIWTFFDILLLLCETRQTGRAIIWYLIEELLDGQTADQCRVVFDYLDSRRDRLTQREFQATHLIVLRSCNELLRKLSKAEDATFCGRVFFFLFQVFPLGEQSSVNLRGEFHTDNVTVFDEDTLMETSEDPKTTSEGSTPRIGSDASFYSTFWGLQKHFCLPTPLLESDEQYADFKRRLEVTIDKFAATPVVATKSVTDDSRSVRSRQAQEFKTDYQGNYNPKYLTSRDLFELELSDLSFQRNILVQALIVLDFLLSLSDKARKKYDNSGFPRSNLPVNYAFTLSEDQTDWAQTTKDRITKYLQQGPEGSFYCRMVNTVLARDRNWTWWKQQRCPPIVREPISTDNWLSSMDGLKQFDVKRPLRAKPMGAMDLTFLNEAGSFKGLDFLKDTARWTTPTAGELIEQRSRLKLDLDFASEAEAAEIRSKMDTLKWRAVRAAARTNLAKLDKLQLDDDVSLEEVLGPEKLAPEPEVPSPGEGKVTDVQMVE